MALIIRPDFTEQDFHLLVKKFFQANNAGSSSAEKNNLLEDELLAFAPDFVLLHAPYFESSDTARFDLMMERMEKFVKMVSKSLKKTNEDRSIAVAFWNMIADRIANDYPDFNDNYLSNTCNYLVYKLKQHPEKNTI